ncbi:MAG: hypothetical protein ABW162_18220, partial [Candidatus Sedimenticola sp. PURPLELP]
NKRVRTHKNTSDLSMFEVVAMALYLTIYILYSRSRLMAVKSKPPLAGPEPLPVRDYVLRNLFPPVQLFLSKRCHYNHQDRARFPQIHHAWEIRTQLLKV